MEDGVLGLGMARVPGLVVGELGPKLDHVTIQLPVMEETTAWGQGK